MCSWPIFVYAEHLWDTVGRTVHQHRPRSCCSRFGTLRPHGYSPVYREAHAEETWTWPAVNGYACYWLFSRSRWIACLLYVKMLEPKLEFPRVCRPLSRRLRLPSLLLVSLTAISCTVLPDLFTEWRHRSPHSHLAGAEGCDRTFTRLNGPAWPPQSTPGMQQPPTRLI